MAMALLFLGMAPEEEKEEASVQSKNSTTIHFLLK